MTCQALFITNCKSLINKTGLLDLVKNCRSHISSAYMRLSVSSINQIITSGNIFRLWTI